VLLLHALLGCSPYAPEPLPELWQAPDFELTNFDGEILSSADLAGKVWAGAFIFTRCPGPCPLISQRMKTVQAQLQNDEAYLVSFTVDPAFDTPAVLRTYSMQWSNNPDNWYFLTSENAEDLSKVAEGFKVAATKMPAESEGPPDITHGTHIFVVDRKGMVRAFVGSSSPDSPGKILDIIHRLAAED